MIYTSTEGEENLFPDYFILPESERLHRTQNGELEDNPGLPRVQDVMNKISLDSSRVNTTVIGEVNAGWTPSGVNAETFWLGYAASTAAGWHPGAPSPSELASTFYSLFYGTKVVDMARVYRLMSEQAQAWTDSWETGPSHSRKPVLGNSYELYKIPQPARDQFLPLPPTPDNDLAYNSTWSEANARRVIIGLQAQQKNNVLLGLLHENMRRSQLNRYNLEVFLMIADLCHQNFAMITGIHDMDIDLEAASQLRDQRSKGSYR